MQKYNLFTNQPWALMPEKLLSLMEIDTATVKAAQGGQVQIKMNSVAHLPLYGMIDQHSSFMLELFGGTSTDAFGFMFDSAIADPSIGAIVIDVDSGGGSVYGVQELSDKIFNARGKKPIIAVVNSLMASAAYWIGSAADEIIITPSGEAGSIGVIAVHMDYSEYEKELGIKPTIITAGKYKAEGNPHEPLGDEAHGNIQSRINEYYNAFVGAVARNRGIGAGKVISDFGQGRVFGAKQAKNAGMVDGIATVETIYRSLAQRKTTMKRAELSKTQNRAILEMARMK